MHDDFLKTFLELYWLRPESAILTSLLAKNIPNDYLKQRKNTADINCGDGIFSFIVNGGKFENSFDLYKSTKIDSSIVKKEDIYNHYDKSYITPIKEYSKLSYSYGIDISDKMLLKASSLKIYEKELLYTGEINLNARAEYPLHTLNNEKISLNNSLDLISIFSSIYMYSNTSYILQKINYLLKKDGIFIVNTKTNLFKKFYESLENTYPKTFSSYIERDMRCILQSLHKEQEWEDFFKLHNFEIIEKKPTLQKNLVPIWSIGLRFLTPLLVKMSTNVTDKDAWFEIKNEFVDTFYKVLVDFYYEDINPNNASSFLYVLKKKG